MILNFNLLLKHFLILNFDEWITLPVYLLITILLFSL